MTIGLYYPGTDDGWRMDNPSDLGLVAAIWTWFAFAEVALAAVIRSHCEHNPISLFVEDRFWAGLIGRLGNIHDVSITIKQLSPRRDPPKGMSKFRIRLDGTNLPVANRAQLH